VSADSSANTITISNPATGTTTTYTLAANAAVKANGSPVTFSSIQAGADVVLQLAAGSTTSITSVNALSQYVAGKIDSVDTGADTVTLKGFNDTKTTYSLSDNATVYINGATSHLGNLDDGNFAEVKLSAFDGKTVTEIDAVSLDIFGHVGHRIQAIVVGVNTTADTITVSTVKNGSTVQTTYTVDSNADITADDSDTVLGDLKAGAHVQLTVNPNSSTDVTAIKASSQFVLGTVGAVDAVANTLTLNRQSGITSTYPVGANATITINGSAASLGAIAAGSHAQITLSAFDGQTATLIADRTAAAFHGNAHKVHGAVTAVDPVANTITVSLTLGGAASTATYTLASGATVTADGAPTPLATLLPGAQVVVTLSAASAVAATSIAATSQVANGLVTNVDAVAGTITLAAHAGAAAATYPVGSTAAITLNGAAVSLASIVAGSRVVLHLSALDAKTVTVLTATTPALIVHHRRVTGTVTGVDLTANTITIYTPAAAGPTTYTLGAGVTLTANGAVQPLASLAAGAKVTLQLTTIGPTTTVNAIVALPQTAVGFFYQYDPVANTISINPSKNVLLPTSYPIGPSVTIKLNGATSTLVALASMTQLSAIHVLLQLSPLDGKTVLNILANTVGH
jgi:hypothetical protein